MSDDPWREIRKSKPPPKRKPMSLRRGTRCLNPTERALMPGEIDDCEPRVTFDPCGECSECRKVVYRRA